MTFCRIRDKAGETVTDILPQDDPRLRDAIRKHQAQASVSHDDIAHGQGIVFFLFSVVTHLILFPML